MRNPPAFDKILIDQYELLERVVTDKRWLPLPVLVATEAAHEIERQRKRASLYSEYNLKAENLTREAIEQDAQDRIKKLMKKKQQRKGFVEYGVGHYGAVYPTQMPGIVCKVTTDRTEAQFVINAISLNKWPDGIVKYYAIFQIKSRKMYNRPVYVLWRDEVSPPQLTHATDSHDKKMIQVVHNVKDIAAWMRNMLLRGKREIPEDYPDYMQFDINAFLHGMGAMRWFNSFRRAPRAFKLAAGMEALRWGMRDQLDWSYAFTPGGAMWFYLEHGMLLADVHSNNIMRGKEGWVISDPGHMIELDDRFKGIHVPEI